MGLRQRAQKPEEDLAPRPVHHGIEMSGQGIAEDLGGDVRIGGAPRVRQQAGVIRLRRRHAVDAKLVAEPHRDHRGV
jgi:hypothetical protein